MASSTVTIDTGEWNYIDRFGIGHVVTNAQTFTLTVTDGGASTVEYNIPLAQSVITTDGYTLTFRPECENASGTGGSAFRTIGYLTDAGQGSDFHNQRGELCIECPVSGVIQRWRVAKINPSDSDFGAAGTITMTLEDQFGNVMVMPATGSGITVGQAS